MRNSLKIAVLILCTICLPFTGNAQQTTGKEDRAFWVENLTRIADPVLVNLSNNTLPVPVQWHLFLNSENQNTIQHL